MRSCFVLLGVLVCIKPIACIPVGKGSLQKNKQAHLLSEEFVKYINEIISALSNSSDFLDHVTSLNQAQPRVNISILSREVRDRLNLIKYKTKNSLVELLKLRDEARGDGHKVALPSDLAKVLDVGNSNEFDAADIEKILKLLNERQEAMDRKELEFLNEVEIMKVLERWESHVNDTDAQKEEAQREFNEFNKKHQKPERFMEPASLEQEREQWKKKDEMPEDNFTPRDFFLLHDLNHDGVWDPEEVDVMLSSQIGQVDVDRPEKKEEYKIQMRQKVMKLVDTNKDGVIDYTEHMAHQSSSEALTDDGWEPNEDEDGDLDDFGPIPEEQDLLQMFRKIQHFEKVDPESILVKRMQQRFEDIQKGIQPKRKKTPIL